MLEVGIETRQTHFLFLHFVADRFVRNPTLLDRPLARVQQTSDVGEPRLSRFIAGRGLRPRLCRALEIGGEPSFQIRQGRNALRPFRLLSDEPLETLSHLVPTRIQRLPLARQARGALLTTRLLSARLAESLLEPIEILPFPTKSSDRLFDLALPLAPSLFGAAAFSST